ncbi:PAS domain S-box protein [uncultured Methanoregula sp.]|uniref:PAS domain S-box protein n=1 Tax=uncultured Methanoregula sp. TaxID=1005933 RepID=UPI002AAB2CFF|nr:PAS domain S-box protein [uncultured Methanoregula sp.]
MIHVLYVGDKPDLLESGKLNLEESGDIAVDTAPSAHAALEMLGQMPYDAIVSDFQLPDMGALPFLEKIQASVPGLPFIVFSDDERTSLSDIRDHEDMSGQKKAIKRLFCFDELKRTLLERVKLYRKKEHYREIIENAREGVVVVQDNRIVFTNPAFREITGGYEPGEMEGRTFTDFVHCHDHEKVIRSVREQFSGTAGDREDIFRVLTRGGGIRCLGSRGIVIEWDGHPAALGFISDVTDRKQAEMALDLTKRKICILNDLTRHDIANRLTVLRGRLKIARKMTQDPRVIRELDEVENAGRDIYRHLETAHTYHDLGMLSPRWFILRSILDYGKIPSDSPDLKIFIDARDTEIYSDPLLPRVFENLIDNSLRHGNHVSEIHITTRETDRGLVIVVEDNGSGIPGEEKEHIFEQGVGKHTGLGLFLSREILSITGITIRETGDAGNGARFEITIPPGAYRPPLTRQAIGLPCT